MNVFANVRSGDVWLLVSIALLLGVDGFLSAAESVVPACPRPQPWPATERRLVELWSV
jgi:hypothetical protein